MWTGSIVKGKGYGQVFVNGRNVRVHRAAYEEYIGPIPSHQHIHHRCRNTTCFNPEHLQLVTAAENNAEMRARHVYEKTIEDLTALVQELRGRG